MKEQEIQKTKRFIKTAFGIVCAGVLVLACLAAWLCSRPVDPSLKPEALEPAVSNAYLALLDDSCYELETGEGLAQLCGFDSWTQTERPETVTHILTLHLAEEYELAFYQGGVVQAYYGYSSRFQRDRVWYEVPEDAAEAVAEFVMKNGTPREPTLGPGSWFTIDE